MGGPQGSFWGPEGSGRSWGGSEGSKGGTEGFPGRFLTGLWWPLEKNIFCFVGGQRSNEILVFSVSCGFVKRSVVIRLCSFSFVFEAYIFAKQ